MENVKQAQKTLQHQLEAIDRETLILLRSIFKWYNIYNLEEIYFLTQ